MNLAELSIILYPDPRLQRVSEPVTAFDDELRALATRMLELMHAAHGVGLAAPQVGVLRRVFVMNVTGEKDDNYIFVNPQIDNESGQRDDEEGCLSIPDVRVQIRRAFACRLRAFDLDGNPIAYEGESLVARVWQHEADHLNGRLILDRMGPADQIATRKPLKDLEDKYAGKRVQS